MEGSMAGTRGHDAFGGVPSERARLSALVDELVGVRRAMAELSARETRILAEAEGIAEAQTERLGSPNAREREMPRRCIAAELGVAVRVNDRGVQSAMNEAAIVTRDFPATLAALADGRISRSHVRAIVDAGHRLPEHVRAGFEEVVLRRAETQSAPHTRAFARQLAERLDPRPMAERHQVAQERRMVSVREVEDGMAELVHLLPTALAHAIHDRLTRQAKAIRAAAHAAVDRYRPSEELKRTLRARDQHCRFPGCRMPARRCDIDHTHDAARGGATALCNLACFCKRHHTLKHATDWTVRQLGDGTLEWTSPTGRTYRDDPPATVVFLPDTDPPPF
jgi:hypothetical protein